VSIKMRGLLALVGCAAAAGAVYHAHFAQARIDREVSWASSGVWLKADTHVHSTFSDGARTVDELVDRAVADGCDVLAITDHTDGDLKAATPEYHAAIAAARARLPGIVLLTGIEWNVPPGKGQDHASVLWPPEMDTAAVTGEFKARFDDQNKEGENPELAATAFAWLRQNGSKASGLPVVFLNHPSRKAKDLAAVRAELQWLSEIGDGLFAGVEGAPGHQHANPLGAYGGALRPEDRWDPAVAPPGAVWDQLLATGSTMSGALATSDFHSVENGDYWPCQFAATWIYAPDRTVPGVLRALRAGSFFGVHGDIARRVQLLVTAEGLPRPAIAGESLHVAAGSRLTVELRAEVPATDWQGQPNHLDLVEILGATAAGTSVWRSGALEDGVLRQELTVPAGGIAIRARGRRVVSDGPDLLFYTNAVQVK
jgi:PHP domain